MAQLTHCRSCQGTRLHQILDLGLHPIANALVEPGQRGQPEKLFPLVVVMCEECSLLQVTETIPPNVLFGRDYPYFSSFSPALLAHSRSHALALVESRKLGPDSLVVEVASNDGYLLKNFVEIGVPVLGVDPAAGPVQAAQKSGVRTLQAFFDGDTARQLAREGYQADVMLAKNVLGHVENINAFVEGFAVLLKEDGIAQFEFPYLRDLIESCAFDTVYHEHVFYYSLTALKPLFEHHGLYLNDVEHLAIHGGSLRLTVSRIQVKSERLRLFEAEEAALGMDGRTYYETFARRVRDMREHLRALVLELRSAGKRIAAYGAAAKGATLLNYAELGGETLAYVVDRNVHKLGKDMPGLRLPIRNVETLLSDRPDYLLLLAWNFSDEIIAQQKAFSDLGGQFIIPVPKPHIVDLQQYTPRMAAAS